jgi:SulP family sulfate permease
MAGLVSIAGMESLFLGVVVAGIIQLIIWASGAWKIFKKIPPSAISGFLIALAIMILVSQFKYLTVGNPSSTSLILTISTILLCAATMIWSSRKFSFPPALVAIAVGCLIGIPLGLATVGDLSSVTASLPTLNIPTFSWSLLLTVLPYSFGMAVSGLTESLLTVDSVSHKLNKPGNKAKETFAQGLGNIVSGFFGTMGGCVLVGQTNLNVNAGAKHRLSGIVAGIGLALIILVFGKWIEQIPLVGLIGVMMVVVYQTGDWQSIKSGNKLNLLSIILTVIISLATHNLAMGVIIGSIAFYFSKLILKHDTSKE